MTDITTGRIDMGGENACQVMGFYDIENYYSNSETGSMSTKKEACLNNPAGACNYEENSENCVSCMLYDNENQCFNEGSHCGWGSIKNVCEVIGSYQECNRMHMEGCKWDPAREKCSLNELTDTDGNPLVPKVGCTRCDDIEHKHTCNSLKNCFWDAITNTDGDNIGQCRAC